MLTFMTAQQYHLQPLPLSKHKTKENPGFNHYIFGCEKCGTVSHLHETVVCISGFVDKGGGTFGSETHPPPKNFDTKFG